MCPGTASNCPSFQFLCPAACIRIRPRISTHTRTTSTSTTAQRPLTCRRQLPNCRTRAHCRGSGARRAAHVLVVGLREKELFGSRIVEGWDQGRFGALVLQEGPYNIRAPASSSMSIPASDDRPRCHASPHAFASKPSRSTVLAPRSFPDCPTRRDDNAVALECFRLVNECELPVVPRWRRGAIEPAVGGRGRGHQQGMERV